MTFTLPELPYPIDALEPLISKETLEYHHGKHHQAYLTNLNKLTQDNEWSGKTLEEIINRATGGVFNNAAQVWNHSFYWNCLTPDATGAPAGQLAEAITQHFGSLEAFKTQFTQAGMTQFGSGWAWLCKDSKGELSIVKTANADNPMRDGLTPLMTCDVWEHAYYVDTRNNRGQYIANFWQLLNWSFVEENYQNA